jgi:hypothetical protein
VAKAGIEVQKKDRQISMLREQLVEIVGVVGDKVWEEMCKES